MRGGYRQNARRPSAFPGIDPKAFSMDFTPAGRRVLVRIVRRTGLSRNNVLTTLVDQHGAELEFGAEGVVFPGKTARNVYAIRMPPAQGDKLRAVRERTGKSYSDIGEALVRWFGRRASYPQPPGKDRRHNATPSRTDRAENSPRKSRQTADQG